jgi:hypothetical protein
MLERVIGKAPSNLIWGKLSIQTPQVIDEKELYGC